MLSFQSKATLTAPFFLLSPAFPPFAPLLSLSPSSCRCSCYVYSAGCAEWLLGKGLVPKTYVASQGTCMQRRGRIYVSAEPVPAADGGVDAASGRKETIWVAGDSVTCIQGTVLI